MKRRIHQWLGVGLAAILVALALSGCSVPPGPASSEGAAQEGIKVHGDWTIEVTNPDGSLAERRQFDNSLLASGAKMLSQILGRQASVGAWEIYLNYPLGGSPWTDGAGGDAPARIVEPGNTATDPHYFKTLTVTVPASGANQDKLVLSGTAVAMKDGSVSAVLTYQSPLDPSLPPASAYGWEVGLMTGTALTSSVSLTAGQQVAVTVVISFS